MTHRSHRGRAAGGITLASDRLVGIEICAEALRLARQDAEPDAAHARACAVCQRRLRIGAAVERAREHGWPLLSRAQADARLSRMAETFWAETGPRAMTDYWQFYATLAAHPDLETAFALLVAAHAAPDDRLPEPPSIPWWHAAECLDAAITCAADYAARATSARARACDDLRRAEALAIRYRVWGEPADCAEAKALLQAAAAAGFPDDRLLGTIRRVAEIIPLLPPVTPGRWRQEDLTRALELHTCACRRAKGDGSPADDQ